MCVSNPRCRLGSGPAQEDRDLMGQDSRMAAALVQRLFQAYHEHTGGECTAGGWMLVCWYWVVWIKAEPAGLSAGRRSGRGSQGQGRVHIQVFNKAVQVLPGLPRARQR